MPRSHTCCVAGVAHTLPAAHSADAPEPAPQYCPLAHATMSDVALAPAAQ
jgi:hypothetical protein